MNQQTEPKLRRYLIVTEAFNARKQEDYSKLDLRLPGEVLGIRESAQQAFDMAEAYSHQLGVVGVKLALVTESQVQEFNRREQHLIAKAVQNHTVRKSQPPKKTILQMLDEYMNPDDVEPTPSNPYGNPRDTLRTPPPVDVETVEYDEPDVEIVEEGDDS